MENSNQLSILNDQFGIVILNGHDGSLISSRILSPVYKPQITAAQ
jgi:hypothetical protein